MWDNGENSWMIVRVKVGVFRIGVGQDRSFANRRLRGGPKIFQLLIYIGTRFGGSVKSVL